MTYDPVFVGYRSVGPLSKQLLVHKLESRLLGEISVTSDMQMTPPLWQKVKRNSKAS